MTRENRRPSSHLEPETVQYSNEFRIASMKAWTVAGTRGELGEIRMFARIQSFEFFRIVCAIKTFRGWLVHHLVEVKPL